MIININPNSSDTNYDFGTQPLRRRICEYQYICDNTVLSTVVLYYWNTTDVLSVLFNIERVYFLLWEIIWKYLTFYIWNYVTLLLLHWSGHIKSDFMFLKWSCNKRILFFFTCDPKNHMFSNILWFCVRIKRELFLCKYLTLWFLHLIRTYKIRFYIIEMIEKP